MSLHTDPYVDTTVLDSSALLAIALRGAADSTGRRRTDRPKVVTDAAVVGAWRTPDGTVQLRLRVDGTYAGAVAGRRRPAAGTYEITGDAVVLFDASGLQTPVTVYEGVLEMAGHRLLPV
jgi:putative ligand-binding protein with streptavidin-like fold